MPSGNLTVSADDKRASLELDAIPVIDQARWPAHDATATPAVMSFRIEWAATDETVTYRDPAKRFVVNGWRATARLEASVEVPGAGFRWRSDPMATSAAAFGVIGREANGRYFE